MKHLKSILLILLFAGCEEYYEPNIDSVKPIYAFEGYVTNLPGPYCVKALKSNGYNAEQQIEYVSDAQVTIECKDGPIYNLTYDANGCYYTDSATFLGKINHSYRLKVETFDGKIFESEYDQLLACPDIEELTAQYYEKNVVTTDGIYFYDEIERGIQVMNSTDTYGHTPYYKYDCRLILQSQQRYNNPPSIIDFYIFRPVSSYGNLYIANAKDYENKHITGNQLFCTSTKLFRYADPSLIEGLEYELINYGEYVRVNQYSMTEAQYNYWYAVKHQIENKNYLFGQIENQAIGNIKCTSNPDEQALGFFGASAVKSAIHAFSLREQKNTVYSIAIDSFPDTDTMIIYNERPLFSVRFSN